MYLSEISKFPSFLPFKKQDKSLPKKFDLISRSFDETLLRRLKALAPPSISLSWLSQAVDFLSLTLTEARTLISNLKVSPFDDVSLALYLDDSVKILDLCNSISSKIERLRQRRLLINILIHLLTGSDSDNRHHFPAPEKILRARNSISDWENYRPVGFKRRGFESNIEDLIRDLALGLGNAPRGKISSVGMLVRRTIHAVGLVTVFVAGVAVSTLFGSPELVTVRAPAEFSWADSFNELESTILAELKRRIGEENKEKRHFRLKELDDVESRIRQVGNLIDEVTGDEKNKEKTLERLNGAVKELEKVTEAYSDGLERLSNGVNGMFHTVLSSRDGLLENLRVGQGEKKSTK